MKGVDFVSRPRSTDRSYWLIRQWAYQSVLPRSMVADEHFAGAGKADDPLSAQQPPLAANAAVRDLLSNGRTEPGNVFCYGSRHTSIRPTAQAMLVVMWDAVGRPVSVEQMSLRVWQRRMPPCHNTLRTTIFRANLALRAVECPLQLSVRGAELILRITCDRDVLASCTTPKPGPSVCSPAAPASVEETQRGRVLGDAAIASRD